MNNIVTEVKTILGDRQSDGVTRIIAALSADGRPVNIKDGSLKLGQYNASIEIWNIVKELHAALGGTLDDISGDDAIRPQLSDFREKLQAALSYIRFNPDGTITIGQNTYDNQADAASSFRGDEPILNATAEPILRELFSENRQGTPSVSEDRIRVMQIAYLTHILERALIKDFRNKLHYPKGANYDVRAAMQIAWFQDPQNIAKPISIVPAADLKAVGLSDTALLLLLIRDAGRSMHIQFLIPSVQATVYLDTIFNSAEPDSSLTQEERYSFLTYSVSPEGDLLLYLTEPTYRSPRVVEMTSTLPD